MEFTTSQRLAVALCTWMLHTCVTYQQELDGQAVAGRCGSQEGRLPIRVADLDDGQAWADLALRLLHDEVRYLGSVGQGSHVHGVVALSRGQQARSRRELTDRNCPSRITIMMQTT
jgi:hypothetical protein